jgi:hypothetical protein
LKDLNLEQQLIFCEKYSINPSELLLLEILLLAQEGEQPEIVNTYFTSRMCARGNTRELLSGLQDAGVITKAYKIPEKGSAFNPLDVPINKNLVKDFFKCSFEMGKELFENYPMFGLINGEPVGIRSVSKKFDSLEDFYRYYGKSISWKPDKHKYIMELVSWAKDNNLLVTTLANFVIDHKWEELEALRNGEIANIDFNAVKQL